MNLKLHKLIFGQNKKIININLKCPKYFIYLFFYLFIYSILIKLKIKIVLDVKILNIVSDNDIEKNYLQIKLCLKCFFLTLFYLLLFIFIIIIVFIFYAKILL